MIPCRSGGSLRAPESERIHVEIVAIDRHVELVDELRQRLGQRLSRLRVVELVQPAAGAAENELRLLAGDLRIGGDSFGLEPEDELHVQFFAEVAHRRHAARKPFEIGEPVAHPVGKRLGEPRRVVPVGVAARLVNQSDVLQLRRFGRPGRKGRHREVAVETLPGDGQTQRPSVGLLGDERKKHQPAEAVVGRDPVALPGHDQDPRAANALAGMQQKMRLLHAGRQPRRTGRRAVEQRRPLARPTDGRDDAFVAILEVEEGERAVRGPPAGRRHGDRLAGGQRRFDRQVRLFVAPVADDLVQHRRLLRVVGPKREVQRLDVFENRRIRRAVVLEVENPVDRRIPLEDAHHGFHLQAGLGILPGVNVRDVIGGLAGRFRLRGVLQQLGRRRTAVAKRERHLRRQQRRPRLLRRADAGDRFRQPIGHRGDFAGRGHHGVLAERPSGYPTSRPPTPHARRRTRPAQE